jgi:hypothetical protein
MPTMFKPLVAKILPHLLILTIEFVDFTCCRSLQGVEDMMC